MYEKMKNGVTPTETLTFMENQLAFGCNITQVNSTSFEITLAGYKKIVFNLLLSAPSEDNSDSRSRSFNVCLDLECFSISGIYVHESASFFSSGVDGISIIYSDREGILRAKYLAHKDI